MTWPFKKKPRRGMGWLRDPHDPSDVQRAFYATGEVPTSADLTSHVTEILDQGSTSSCVAHAFAYAIMVAESQAGLRYDPISREYLYYNARAITGDQDRDEGTYLRNAAKSLVVMGAAPESSWPFNPKTLNKAPGIGAHMLAHPRRNGTYSKVFGSGSARCNSIKRALAAGHAVCAGFDVTNDIFDVTDGIVEKPISDSAVVGGHALAIVGFDMDGFRIVNSWNTSWGDRGFATFSNEYVGSTYCSDIYIVQGWDRLKQIPVAQQAIA